MVTGDEVPITKYEYQGGDLSGISYYKTKVTCYTQDGILLWNADVNAYNTSALPWVVPIIVVSLFIGFILGVILTWVKPVDN